jgi:hypothetical protein
LVAKETNNILAIGEMAHGGLRHRALLFKVHGVSKPRQQTSCASRVSRSSTSQTYWEWRLSWCVQLIFLAFIGISYVLWLLLLIAIT